MSENPYQAPETSPASSPGSVDRADLLRVGKAQRAIMLIILVSLISVGLSFKFPLAGLANIAAGLLAMVFLFRLARALQYPIVVCLILALFSFVPLLGLLILFSVNARASKRLQANGIRVGLMGANKVDLEALAHS